MTGVMTAMTHRRGGEAQNKPSSASFLTSIQPHPTEATSPVPHPPHLQLNAHVQARLDHLKVLFKVLFLFAVRAEHSEEQHHLCPSHNKTQVRKKIFRISLKPWDGNSTISITEDMAIIIASKKD